MNRFITILFVFVGQLVFSQVQNLPLNFKYNQLVEKYAVRNDEVISIKPFNRQFLSKKTYDEVYADSNKYYYEAELKFFKENLLDVNEKDVKLVADPLFDFMKGRSFYGDSLTKRFLSTNTRGVRVAGDITSKFSFETRYYETQLVYPVFLDSIARKRSVAFGKGRAKPFKNSGWDVGTAMGYISFAATKWLNVQFGNTNQFIGNGYRSLLLSDNCFNYPNLTIQGSFANGKIRYMNTNAWLQTTQRIPVSSTPEAQFKSKDATFRYLVFHPVKQFEIGIFEGTIYKTYHDSIGEIKPNYSFYIPVIGVAGIVNGLKSENKVLLGVNANYRIKKRYLVFGQFAMDANGKAYQIGAKWYDFMNIQHAWLHVEYDHVDPYMYTMSAANSLQTYSNSNQALAYALGASSNELLSKIYLPYNRFYGMVSVFLATKKRYNGTVYGEDIFKPNDVVTSIPPKNVNWNYSSVEVGYNMNVQTRMNIYLNFAMRNQSGGGVYGHEIFWQLGFRTQLNNYYLER